MLLLGKGSEICPLSSTMELSDSHYFYPLDIYAPHSLYEKVQAENKTFTCIGSAYLKPRVEHNCSSAVKFCPVHSENVIDATRRKYNDSASLCYLQRRLK